MERSTVILTASLLLVVLCIALRSLSLWLVCVREASRQRTPRHFLFVSLTVSDIDVMRPVDSLCVCESL